MEDKRKILKLIVMLVVILGICLMGSNAQAFTLTLTPEPERNAIRLDWDGEGKNYYKIWQLKPGDYEYHSISAIDVYTTQQKVQVLNIYPGDGEQISFSTYDGENISIAKSGNLKQWMEEPNSEDSKGYGRGLIEVTSVSNANFNTNPSAYLSKDSNGNYFYDVVYVGHWDYNGHKSLSDEAVGIISEFLDAGRGVLCRP